MPDMFLVWSNEHRRWWGPGYNGYTGIIEEAGRYTLTEAREICRQATVDGLLHLNRESHLTGARIDILPEHLVPAPETVPDTTTARDRDDG